MSKGEFELIRRLAAELAPPRATSPGVPFGDDMASLPGHEDLLLATDMLMDGVDFDSRVHAWRAIGRKAMAVNLSDCAAMAVRPVAALCAVALQDRVTMDDALELTRGLRACGEEFDCPLIGGDTNSWSSPTVVSVTVAAVADGARRPLRRDGARPGDRIGLTGPVGGSLLGRHMTFVPRVREAVAIHRALAPHAMIDISDGLAIDLWRVLDASGCGAELAASALDAATHPDAAARAAADGVSARDHALYDGEDFELIVVYSADAPPGAAARAGLMEIGRCVAGHECVVVEADGRRAPVQRRGWEHFR